MNTTDTSLTLATVARWLQTATSPVVDLAPVTRSDSAGIALLLELTRRARAQGQTLEIRNANPQVRALAQFFGVDSLLNFQ